jgi:hypothetical protein
MSSSQNFSATPTRNIADICAVYNHPQGYWAQFTWLELIPWVRSALLISPPLTRITPQPQPQHESDSDHEHESDSEPVIHSHEPGLGSDEISHILDNIFKQYCDDHRIFTSCQQSNFMSRYTGINCQLPFIGAHEYIADHFTEHQLIHFLSILGQCVCCDRHICSNTQNHIDIDRNCHCACRHYRRIIPRILLCYSR